MSGVPADWVQIGLLAVGAYLVVVAVLTAAELLHPDEDWRAIASGTGDRPSSPLARDCPDCGEFPMIYGARVETETGGLRIFGGACPGCHNTWGDASPIRAPREVEADGRCQCIPPSPYSSPPAPSDIDRQDKEGERAD